MHLCDSRVTLITIVIGCRMTLASVFSAVKLLLIYICCPKSRLLPQSIIFDLEVSVSSPWFRILCPRCVSLCVVSTVWTPEIFIRTLHYCSRMSVVSFSIYNPYQSSVLPRSRHLICSITGFPLPRSECNSSVNDI